MKNLSGLRDQTFSTSSGKNVSQTKQLSNGARPTKGWNAENMTKEYKTGSTSMGPLGGKNHRK